MTNAIITIKKVIIIKIVKFLIIKERLVIVFLDNMNIKIIYSSIC